LRHEQLITIVEDERIERLVRDLIVDGDSEPSPFLDRISEQFSECCRDLYKVVSFFERKSSPTVEVRWFRAGEREAALTV